MKTKNLFVIAVLVLTATASPALAQQTQTFDFPVANGTVPDADLNGFQNTAQLNFDAVLTDVKVTLNISGGYNGDLYAYLTHDSGFAVLLNRVGRTSGNLFGYGDAGLNITLSDTAATDVHLYGGNAGQVVGGSWQPDERKVDPAGSVDTSPRTAALASFNGVNAQGAWTLFVADLSAGGQSTVSDWKLQVTIVPEPAAARLGILAAVLLGIAAHVSRCRKRTRTPN
jgi:subtilisin-like proprotein convertase family protein